MKKIEVAQKGMKIPKVEFILYCKLDETNLIELNKSLCDEERISLSVPVQISEDINLFNSSGEYYNDRCSKTKSDSGTDILLKDRQKEFVEGNKTICQDDCDFNGYDHDTQKANCSCKVQESSSSIANIGINTEKLYEKFEDSNKEFSNLGLESCNVFASKENIISNAGFFLLLIIIFLFIIISILFCTKGYRMLEDKINNVIYKRFKNEINLKKTIPYKRYSLKRTKTTNNEIIETKDAKNRVLRRNRKTKTNYIPSGSMNFLINKEQKKQNNSSRKSKRYSSVIKSKISNNDKSEYSDNKPETDYEFNWLNYKEALRFVTRTKCKYYCSLVGSKQLFIFTFCSFEDYNSSILKKVIFFLSFAMHYTANALFFDESNMHQIYEDKGKYNFLYQLPYTLYSALISTFIIRLILHTLVLTDNDILKVKLQKTKEKTFYMKNKKLKCMKIKFFIFFILNFILLGLFLYYLTIFNVIYANTQLFLIKNTLISFCFSLFTPFIIYFL